jgi:hypothetical protein
MSEHRLPDDPDRWPENPCELLGVPFGTSLADLRRAYTRLIRAYKPEQYPDQFRRIRAAYDCLLPYVRDVETSTGPSTVPDTATHGQGDSPSTDTSPPEYGEIPPDDRQVPGSPAEQPRVARESLPSARDVEEELDELWNTAIDGDPAVAYGRLVQLSHQHAGKVDIYQRLWWLLISTPSLQVAEMPADWLVRGLRATGLAGPLRELYREAVERDPAEAFSARFASVLEIPMPPGLLAELLEWRIRAASELGKWDDIAEDVRRFSTRLHREDEKIWLRILFALADHVAWASGDIADKLWQSCAEEIKNHEHLAVEFSRMFDRFDWLKGAAPGFRQLLNGDGVPEELLEIIRLAWSSPYTDLFPQMKSILGEVAGDPQRWLIYFDNIQAKSPGALALFGRMLNSFESQLPRAHPMEADPEIATSLVLGFLGQSVSASRLVWSRARFLELCLLEAVMIEQMAEAAARLPMEWAEAGAQFSRAIASDWPLRYVTRAWHLFWA